MLKAVYSTRLLYVVGTMLVKMSLLTFYLRLDQRTRGCLPFRRVISNTRAFIARHPLQISERPDRLTELSRLARTGMRWTVFVLMFVTAAFSAASFGVLTFLCYPPSVFWTEELGDGWCMDRRAQQKFYDANGALNIAIDLAIYVVPVPMLWRVQLPARQKILLAFIFGLALVAVAGECLSRHRPVYSILIVA